MNKRLMLPLVHLNGTSQSDLLAQFEACYDALKEAERVLRLATPHGRDYYPLPDEDGKTAHQFATDQHRDRSVRLANITNEFEALAEGLMAKQLFAESEVMK